MRNLLNKKLSGKKGFTLAELLIVVAIIAILIAIMLPVFGKSRADAIQAKDASNVRSAYSEAIVTAMSSGTVDATSGKLKITVDTSDLGIDTSTTVDVVTDSDPATKPDGAKNGDIYIDTKGASRILIISVDEGLEVEIK